MELTDTAAAQQDFQQGSKTPPAITDRDIIFACSACQGELVVDQDGAGMTFPCPHCGQSLTIPEFQSRIPAHPAPLSSLAEPRRPTIERHFDFSGQTSEQIERRSSDLQHQLKENRSQDTEMRGHVNRATMELHRFQLKLKKLQERQADIEAELTAIQLLPPRGE